MTRKETNVTLIKDILFKFEDLNLKKNSNIALYIEIFKMLSDNNNVVNYTSSSKKVMFDLNNIQPSKLNTLHDILNKYIDNYQYNTSLDLDRQETIKKMSDTIKSEDIYKHDIKRYITSNEHVSSSINQLKNHTSEYTDDTTSNSSLENVEYNHGEEISDTDLFGSESE